MVYPLLRKTSEYNSPIMFRQFFLTALHVVA